LAAEAEAAVAAIEQLAAVVVVPFYTVSLCRLTPVRTIRSLLVLVDDLLTARLVQLVVIPFFSGLA
jgi:hypothetical protein